MGLSKEILLTVKDYEVKLNKDIKFYENDTIDLCFSILEYGIEVKNGMAVNKLMPINALKAYMLIETPQGVDYAESTKVEDNRVVFNLGDKYSQFVGIGKMQIVIKDNDGCRITLPEFPFEIRQSINSDWDRNITVLSTEASEIIVDEFGREIALKKISEMEEANILPIDSYSMILDNNENKKIKTNLITQKIENDLQLVNEQLETMKQQKANQTDLEIQKSRIDNLTKLGEGSTTGDAELQDVRIGANGLIYQNAGDAVREIAKGNGILDNSIYISKIKGSKVLKSQNMFNYEKAQTGKLKSDGTVDTSIITNVTSEFIEINNDVVKNYKVSESCNICFYDNNKNLLKYYSNQNYVSSVSGSKYIRVSPLVTSYEFILVSNINTLPSEFIAPIRKELLSFELDENSTSIKCVKEIIKTYSNNLFDKNNITKGYSVSNTKGYLVKNESYCSSDFIEVIENTQYETTKGVNLAFYDADCQYISGLSYSNGKIFTTPQNCKYCRISVLLTELDMFMMAKNNLPSTYEPYVKYSFDESLFELPSNIDKTSILKGKTINCLGDSFTNTSICWHKHIADRTGCIINNYGVSGSAIASYSNPYTETFVERYNSMTSECDIVVVFGGINDAYTLDKGRITLGDMNSTELTTFYGALKTLCEGLIAKYPDKLILALLPPNIIKNAENGADTRYRKINEIVEAEKEVYTHYGIPYLDLRTASTISTTDSHISLYNASPTNLHWNEAGHKRASYPIQKFIESYTY